MNEVSFKGKSEETNAKRDTNLRGKASGWLRHREILTEPLQKNPDVDTN